MGGYSGCGSGTKPAGVTAPLSYATWSSSGLLDEIEASADALVLADGTSIRGRIVTALGDLATDLLAHLAFEEEALGPTTLELEEWPY
jgi:hypothetical protein